MLLVTRNLMETIADSFSVTFKDGCRTFREEPKFLVSEAELFLYEEKVFFFTRPILDCPAEIATPPDLQLIDEDTEESLSPEICQIIVIDDVSVG